MTGDDPRPDSPADDAGAGWPVDLRGVTESLVATLGPNGRWNVAALGLFAGDPVTATTWGRTRTRGNFHRRGEGYVQFTRDPVAFVDAACSIVERAEPVVESADAWARVEARSVDAGEDEGTEWERWELVPLESRVECERVPTIDRGLCAVVEATVAASRLGVPGYDDATLRARLERCAAVVERTGGPRELEAMERLESHADLDLDGE